MMASTAVRWLGLAASPTFALLALVTAVDPARPALCGGAGIVPIDAMTAMYVLMSLFHLPPWFGLRQAMNGA